VPSAPKSIAPERRCETGTVTIRVGPLSRRVRRFPPLGGEKCIERPADSPDLKPKYKSRALTFNNMATEQGRRPESQRRFRRPLSIRFLAPPTFCDATPRGIKRPAADFRSLGGAPPTPTCPDNDGRENGSSRPPPKRSINGVGRGGAGGRPRIFTSPRLSSHRGRPALACRTKTECDSAFSPSASFKFHRAKARDFGGAGGVDNVLECGLPIRFSRGRKGAEHRRLFIASLSENPLWRTRRRKKKNAGWVQKSREGHWRGIGKH
jgi:hypothetical protein